MKFFLTFLALLCVTQAFNKACIGELAKLGIDLAKLNGDLSVGAILRMARDASKTYVEFRKVLSVCGSSAFEALSHVDMKITDQLLSAPTKSCEEQESELIKNIEADLEKSQTINDFKNSINLHYASALKLGTTCALSFVSDQSFIQNALTKSIPQIKLCFESFSKLRSANKSLKDIFIYGIQFAYNCDIVNQEQFLTLPQLKDCVHKGQNFANEAQVVLTKLTNGVDYLEKEFIDQSVRIAESIEPLLHSCSLNTLDDKWNTVLPKKCIDILGSLAHDKRKLRDDIDRPIFHKKDEIKYKVDLALAIKDCPFIASHVIKK